MNLSCVNEHLRTYAERYVNVVNQYIKTMYTPNFIPSFKRDCYFMLINTLSQFNFWRYIFKIPWYYTHLCFSQVSGFSFLYRNHFSRPPMINLLIKFLILGMLLMNISDYMFILSINILSILCIIIYFS